MVEDHWFNVAYNPLRELDGTVTGIIAVLTDVTVQVLARQEVERVNRELEEFAYVASHDLQEPLRMVNIYTQLLVRDFCSKDPKAEKYAGLVRQGVTRMERLIRDLLSYSRSVQKDELPVGKADLAAALTEAISVLKNRIEENAAVVTADSLPVLRGDTAQIAHVFQNLLSNALKYRKTDSVPKIHISATLNSEQCVVCIQDNGIGFEQQYAQRIFGLFKRLHKDEYPGTGLGLAICQRIVERYGGRMWAEGTPREGAKFYFSLPCVAEE
jgi:light-regulated signal transduction histidine kinase (bacteriophytochrome)